MSIQNRLKFEIELDGNNIDVTSYVKTATARRGRAHALAENWPGQANLVLHDPDRDFDPFNNGTRIIGGNTFDQDDLIQGAKVTISLRKNAASAYKIRWAGEVDDWLPTTWEGDNTDTNPAVVVSCIGRVGNLNRILTPTAGDMLDDKMKRAPSGCWYTFDTANGTTGGNVEDFSRFAANATVFTNESSGTTTYTAGTNFSSGDSVQLVNQDNHTGADVVRSTMTPDTMRTGSGGFIMVAEIRVEANPGSFQASRNWDVWVIASDGRDGTAQSEPSDGWSLFLREDRNSVGTNITDNNNDMDLVFVAMSHEDGTNGDTWTLINSVGVRDDWVNHERAVILISDGTTLRVYAVSLDGDTIDSSTSLEFSGAWSNLTLAGVREYDYDAPKPYVRFGAKPLGTGTRFIAQAVIDGAGFSGEFRTAALAACGANESWGDQFAAAVLADGAIVIPGASDRIDSFLTDIGFPSADFTKDITSGLSYLHPPNVGRATALTRVNELCVNEQGRLCQKVGGDVEFDDFSACQTQSAANGEPTYSDQHETGDYPYEDAVLTTGRGQIVNRCTTRLESGYIHTADDATSQSKHGDRPAEYDLILASEDDADTFADTIVDRFATQRKHIAQIVVNPKSKNENDATVDWWAELDARDIGDRVNVERQPAGTGTVTSVASVIEGESWSWNASADQLLFTFYFSPAAFYDSHTYP